MSQTFDLKKIKRFVLTSQQHIMWGEEQWNMVHFSDESKFKLFGSDGKRFVRRKNGERLSPKCVKKTLKFGGGVGPIIRFHGNINVGVYKELLRLPALPHLLRGRV